MKPVTNPANKLPAGPAKDISLTKATKPFEQEDQARSLRLLAATVAAAVLTVAAIPWLPNGILKLAMGALAGLVQVRLFIFFHDYEHGAILRTSRTARWFMAALGLFMLAARSVWRETHNYHHAHNSKLAGSSIGSYPLVSLKEWRRFSCWQRLRYRLSRHWLTILSGYLTVFLWGMCVSPFRRRPRAHWAGPVALLLHAATFLTAAVVFGWANAACMVLAPRAVNTAVGAYLFYAQHNFPDMRLRSREDWNYTFAALRSTSMFEMGRLMHWLTGNIGHHHVHHINSRIPFYRLPEAMAAIPQLQDVGRTSWRLRDIVACLQVAVWDDDADRMLTYRELRQLDRGLQQGGA